MKTFAQFLTEDNQDKLLHLAHPEDTVLDGGQEGFRHSVGALRSVYDKLKGKFNPTKVTEKLDGSPSLVWGTNPDNGKFFVGTKSAFNTQTPKINYTAKDIERNHGHAPDLVHKLKTSLEHLPKVTPPHGVYQGDVMYTPDDVTEHDNTYHFTPNTLMYSVPTKSEEGDKIKHAKLGLVVHTKYSGPSLQRMKAGFEPDIHNFKKHNAVHLMHNEVDDGVIDAKNDLAFRHHINHAEKSFNDAHPDMVPVVQSHAKHLKTYINSTVREGTKPTLSGYKLHLMSNGMKQMDAVKTPKAKQQHQDRMMDNLAHVERHTNHFDRFFKIHQHMTSAKNALVNSLNSGAKWETSINGEAAHPEGFVVVHESKPLKLVDRSVFSHHNMLNPQHNRTTKSRT